MKSDKTKIVKFLFLYVLLVSFSSVRSVKNSFMNTNSFQAMSMNNMNNNFQNNMLNMNQNMIMNQNQNFNQNQNMNQNMIMNQNQNNSEFELNKLKVLNSIMLKKSSADPTPTTTSQSPPDGDNAYKQNTNHADKFNNSSKELPNSASDKYLQSIRNELINLANDNIKTPDFSKKARGNGNFSKNYSSALINRGADSRRNVNLWGFMNDVVEVFEFCVNPVYKINYNKWCNNSFMGSAVKNSACNNSFCKVCCDHIQLMLINISKKELLGEKLELNTDQGATSIGDIVNSSTQDKCKSRCDNKFQIKLPSARPTPERDPTLGQQENPANDCSDLQRWGREGLPSNTYWIKTTKGIFAAWCDMTTDGGGWTLFFNYRHGRGSNFSLNGTKLPKDLHEPAHININNFFPTGGQVVKQLRFICSENYKSQNYFWHFRTNNLDLINLAKNGVQYNVLKVHFYLRKIL